MSIRLRLTLYWAIVTATILFAVGVLILFFFSRDSRNALDKTLLEEADTSATALSHSSNKQAIAILRHLVDEKDLGPGRRVRLIVGDRVLFDDGDQKTLLPTGVPKHATSTVIQGGRRRYRFAVVPFSFDGQGAWLQDGVDTRPISYSVARLRRTLLLLLPVIFVLCVAGGYWLSASALNPVNAMAAALARIGPHDLTQRLPTPKVRDEAGLLVEEINELLVRLERASVAQQRFVAEAAHELRTPLTVLRTGLEVTLQRPRSVEESRVAMEEALGEVERLCAIAEDLLALARIGAAQIPNHEIVDFGDVVKAAAERVEALAGVKHQTLAVQADAALIVGGNRTDVQRVVLNLLDNAIKFTPDGGSIEISATRDERCALLSVCDNGPGIEPQEIARVFDRFYRSPRLQGAGSGLGLALCREIVRLHGGDIRAANRKVGGCEVQVRLPLVTSQQLGSESSPT